MTLTHRRITKRFMLMFLSILFVFVTGCGAAGILVVKSPETRVRVSSVNVYEEKSAIVVPVEVRLATQQKLEQLLYSRGVFTKGSELSIRYRFVHLDPGNRFNRWFWSSFGNSGEGSITIQARFFDSANVELAVVEAEGLVWNGLFGGGLLSAVEKAAEELADYAHLNYGSAANRSITMNPR